jgi:hypothetical protein
MGEQHGESVESVDQTVGPSIDDRENLCWFTHLPFKPADLQAESRS